jgi:sigma-54 dependent transcriptional regulator, acetoin dehydrogenase operon transcriptional activator AcoR
MIDDDRGWLEHDSGRGTATRPEIVQSWRRCRLNGVSADEVPIVEGEMSPHARLSRIAVPVLSAMAEVMIGANTSLLLSAPDGTMLWRWSEDSRLAALLDRNSALPGTRWSEDVVGTNGLGTALETIRPVMIRGGEHYSEALHHFTCAGAPIRHPITRRVSGVLSVTSLNKDASPLMGATLKKLAREVEEQLYGDSTLRERELLHHFLTERRRGRAAVVAVNEDTVIANKAGTRLGIDHRSLWNQIESGAGDDVHLDLDDASGTVDWRVIKHAGAVVGLVLVGEPTDPGPKPAAPAPAALQRRGPVRPVGPR